MANGTVKWFNDSKGMASSPDEGTDLFVHHGNIIGDGYRARRGCARRVRAARRPKALGRRTSSQLADRLFEAVAAHVHGPPPQRIVNEEKDEKIEVEGEVIEALRSRMFRVRLDNGHEALGYMGGRMKRYRIRVFPGDRVRIELSSYDLTRGRIVYRLS
jgi:translation initiation factor IF-1